MRVVDTDWISRDLDPVSFVLRDRAVTQLVGRPNRNLEIDNEETGYSCFSVFVVWLCDPE